ncbi:hypothetical protein BB934_32960 (plasmid) [Microvirga ossetica]|uniref:Uncharacterized protein n=1 Tax=Microvirga ossetica TaxID=1882682 RepID=A0A1B2ESR8_9HYPH|nr:hypothetical protein BB934_32960 [Microvirga ossetica]
MKLMQDDYLFRPDTDLVLVVPATECRRFVPFRLSQEHRFPVRKTRAIWRRLDVRRPLLRRRCTPRQEHRNSSGTLGELMVVAFQNVLHHKSTNARTWNGPGRWTTGPW